jgi:hypothetical protein
MANRNGLNGLNNINNNELPDISLYVGPAYNVLHGPVYDDATLTTVIRHLPKYFRVYGDSPEFVMLLFRLLILYERTYFNELSSLSRADLVDRMSPEQMDLFTNILIKYKIPITDRTIVPATNPPHLASEYVFVNNNENNNNKINIIDRINNVLLLYLYKHDVKFIINPIDIIKNKNYHHSRVHEYMKPLQYLFYDKTTMEVKRGYFFRSLYEMHLKTRMPAVIAFNKISKKNWSPVEHYNAPIVAVNTPYKSNNFKKSFLAWGTPVSSNTSKTSKKTANPITILGTTSNKPTNLFSIWGTPIAGAGAGSAGAGAGAKEKINPFSIWGVPMKTRKNNNKNKTKNNNKNKNNKNKNSGGVSEHKNGF